MNMSTGFFHPSVCWSNSAAAELLEHTLSYEIGAQASHRENAEILQVFEVQLLLL